MTQLSLLDALEIPIPTPLELMAEIPLTRVQERFVEGCRQTLQAILSGRDQRLVLVVGPCSIHDYDSTFEYAAKLKKLSNRVQDRFFLVMRTYFEKPRTSRGWKGFLYDPDLDGSYDMRKGLKMARQMLVELAEMEVPTGSELLEINTAHYFLDLLSWGCIGARTSSSQPHRQMASSTPLPIGFKNTTDGNIANAINGVLSARSPHIFLGLHPTGQLGKIYAGGNAFAHLVLRGGEGAPNYHPPLVQKAMDQCHQAGINGRLFIDCSHGNSGKRMEMQVPVFQSVISQRMDGNQQIVGAMLESHLKAGSQGISTKLEYGISVTDPCLDWETTESLILEAYQK